MFNTLPQPIKEQILHFLEKDNFVKAKALHDAWFVTNDANVSNDLELGNLDEIQYLA